MAVDFGRYDAATVSKPWWSASSAPRPGFPWPFSGAAEVRLAFTGFYLPFSRVRPAPTTEPTEGKESVRS
jgi:hypothetical protein